MNCRIWILVLAAACVAAPTAAQESGGAVYQAFLKVLRLPAATQEARVLGVPESDIRSILDSARDRRVRAADITELFEGGNESIRKHGPVDNFGAFVQQRLGEGLRGRDLAAAIRAEHAARGKGKGHEMSPGAVQGTAKPPDAVGDRGGAKRPHAADGKPDSSGKSRAAKEKKGGSR